MRDDDHRTIDAENGVRIAVDMNDVGIVTNGQTAQPIEARREVCATPRHPFQPITALGEQNIVEPPGFLPLSNSCTRPYCREDEPGLWKRHT
jgi:hypothetical protein